MLLKNDGAILPLDATRDGKIAVIGPNAKTAQIMGGGSAPSSIRITASRPMAGWRRCSAKTG